MPTLDPRKQRSPSRHEQHIKSISQELNRSGLSSKVLQRTLTDLPVSAADIMMLQRTIGNQAVQRLLDGKGKAAVQGAGRSEPAVQRGLKVGAANDSYEQEAEQVARQIGGISQPVPLGKRAQPKSLVQREAEGSFETGSDFESRLKQTEGSGKALPEKTRAEFEPKFGVDLGGVRVHTSPASTMLNRAIQAKAFTHGKDIHFIQGAYNPDSTQGKQVLAHELTHTIQQSGGAPRHNKGSGIQRSPTLTPTSGKTIQRIKQRLKVTTAELSKSESWSESVSSVFGAGSGDVVYDDVKNVLRLYEGAKTLRRQLKILNGLVHCTSEWLSRHSSPEETNTGRYILINRLLNEVVAEIPQVSAMIRKANKKAKGASPPLAPMAGNGAIIQQPVAPPTPAPSPMPHKGGNGNAPATPKKVKSPPSQQDVVDEPEFQMRLGPGANARDDLDDGKQLPDLKIVQQQIGDRKIDLLNSPQPVADPPVTPDPIPNPAVTPKPVAAKKAPPQKVAVDAAAAAKFAPNLNIAKPVPAPPQPVAPPPVAQQLAPPQPVAPQGNDPQPNGPQPNDPQPVAQQPGMQVAGDPNVNRAIQIVVSTATFNALNEATQNYVRARAYEVNIALNVTDDQSPTTEILVYKKRYKEDQGFQECIDDISRYLNIEIKHPPKIYNPQDDLDFLAGPDRERFEGDPDTDEWGKKHKFGKNNLPIPLDYEDEVDFAAEDDKRKGTKAHNKQNSYLRKVLGNENKNLRPSLKYLSSVGNEQAVITNSLLNHKRSRDGYNKDATPLQKLMLKYGLTRAEAIALSIYTSPDFLYMNPALTGRMDMMTSNLVAKEIVEGNAHAPVNYLNPATQQYMEKTRNRDASASLAHAKNAKKEGDLHNKYALKGLKKLPDVKQTTYRGMGLTQEEVNKQFVDTRNYSWPAFTSTSKDFNQARGFAKSRAAEHKNRSVVLTMHLTKGKDVGIFAKFKTEQEIMVLPNAQFAVVDVKETADAEVPGGLIEVELQQVD